MRFSTRQDADVPAGRMFDAVADFDRLEQMMVKRGARVTRLDPDEDSPMSWDVEFNWRGRTRNMRVHVTRFDRPRLIEIQGRVESLDISLTAEVTALSHSRSRLDLEAELMPRNMKARLLIQTAKLTRSTLDRKFDEGVARYIEQATA